MKVNMSALFLVLAAAVYGAYEGDSTLRAYVAWAYNCGIASEGGKIVGNESLRHSSACENLRAKFAITLDGSYK